MVMRLKDRRKIIENLFIPILLVGLCFFKVNRGIDLTDAGYNIDFFHHYNEYSGTAFIAIWGSVFLGHLFTLLPGGTTWLGIVAYCQIIWVLLALTAYFFCKRYFSCYMVAIAEALAILYCWNPSVVLYDYLSFLLFQVGIILLINGIENDSWKYMALAGVILGIDVFVRIPNVVYCMSIGLLWGYAIFEGKKWKWTLQRTFICFASYIMGAAIPLTVILTKYSWNEFKVAIFNLFALSENRSNYGIVYMATQTLQTIFSQWYRIRLSWNPSTATMLPITSFILLVGIIACILDLFVTKDTKYRILNLAYLGVLYVTPLGSNNGVYLSMLNMFLLLPLEIAAIKRLLDKFSMKMCRTVAIIKVLCGVVATIFAVEIGLFGIRFTWKDSPTDSINNPHSYLDGMATSAERAEELQDLEMIFQKNGWTGNYGILYCDAPGLAAILDLKPVMLSQWADWPTYSDDNFEKGIIRAHQLVKQKEYPIVILNCAYYEVYEGLATEENTEQVQITEKYYLLAKFLRDNDYECTYSTNNYRVYTINYD